jgi:hypothetical protein
MAFKFVAPAAEVLKVDLLAAAIPAGVGTVVLEGHAKIASRIRSSLTHDPLDAGDVQRPRVQGDASAIRLRTRSSAWFQQLPLRVVFAIARSIWFLPTLMYLTGESPHASRSAS